MVLTACVQNRPILKKQFFLNSKLNDIWPLNINFTNLFVSYNHLSPGLCPAISPFILLICLHASNLHHSPFYPWWYCIPFWLSSSTPRCSALLIYLLHSFCFPWLWFFFIWSQFPISPVPQHSVCLLSPVFCGFCSFCYLWLPTRPPLCSAQ